MWLLLVNAFVFATLLIVVVVPALYIKDAATLIDKSVVPPTPGERVEGSGTPQDVRQRLYLLFVIPLCALLNGVFVYLTYYRPLRFVQYRVELNEQSLRLHRMFARKKLSQHMQQLQQQQQQMASGGGGGIAHNRSFASMAVATMQPLAPSHTMSFAFANNYSSSGGGGGGGSASMVSNLTSTLMRDASYYDAQIRSLISDSASTTFARPKMVKRDEYVLTFTYPEVKALCTQVERSFFIACTIAEKNFCMAVRKAFGVAALQELEWVTSTIFGNNNNNNNSNNNYSSSNHNAIVGSGGSVVLATMTPTTTHAPDDVSYNGHAYEYKSPATVGVVHGGHARDMTAATAGAGMSRHVTDMSTSAVVWTAASAGVRDGAANNNSNNNNTTTVVPSKPHGFRFIPLGHTRENTSTMLLLQPQEPSALQQQQPQQTANSGNSHGARVVAGEGGSSSVVGSSRSRYAAMPTTTTTTAAATAGNVVYDGDASGARVAMQHRNGYSLSPPLRIVVNEPVDG